MTGRMPQLVSVVMPVLDAEHHIGEQVAALREQTYGGDWELVLVDNGSTDQSIAVARALSRGLPSLRVVETPLRRNLNHARNVGAAEARGSLLAFCDADDVAAPGWLAALVHGAAEAELAAGRLELHSLNSELVRAWHPHEPVDRLPHGGHGFLPFAPGGNCAVWTEVAREIRWDESFRFGSSDKEFAWRAQLAGHRLTYVPDAVIGRRFKARLPAIARQHFDYGRSHAQLYRSFRSAGMTRPPHAEAVSEWRRLRRRLWPALKYPAERGRWTRQAAIRCGRLAGSARTGVLFP